MTDSCARSVAGSAAGYAGSGTGSGVGGRLVLWAREAEVRNILPRCRLGCVDMIWHHNDEELTFDASSVTVTFVIAPSFRRSASYGLLHRNCESGRV